MSILPAHLASLLQYATPPLVGGFIGYLTNRIAIRMLFRPLKTWRIASIRVPMTPGVIPAKRFQLAENMGEVVGDHLLTSKEIGYALQDQSFQKHLYGLIHERIEAVIDKDLGPLSAIIPKKFLVYFDIGQKTLSYQLKEQVRNFIQSPECAQIVNTSVEDRVSRFLQKEIGEVVAAEKRDQFYSFLEQSLRRMFTSQSMDQWVDDFVHERVFAILQQQKSMADILPPSLTELLLDTVEKQVPVFLSRLGEIVREPEVRERIVKGACEAVSDFINSLGSMADMVRGFVRMETVEEKIRQYLIEKDEDIGNWLQSEELQQKVVAILRERGTDYLNRPIAQLFHTENDEVVEQFCDQCRRQILLILHQEDIAVTLGTMIKANLESQIDGGVAEVGEVLTTLLGEESMHSGLGSIRVEIRKLLQAESTQRTIDSVVDSLFTSVLQKPIGRLANIVPVGVREGLSQSLLKITSNMLENEVPGLVQSLNIRKIVTEKINSLDLLRLERLLLSIMEEQFKYINLFGALLGFLIGCVNLLILYGL